MKKDWAIFKHAAKICLNQRLDMVVANLQSVFTLFILFNFWQFVYQGREVIRGYTFPQMVTHYFLVRITYNRVATLIASRVAKNIKGGQLTAFLLRPVSFLRFSTITEFAREFFWTTGNLIIVLCLSPFLYQILIKPNHFFVFFLVALGLNAFLSIAINHLIGSLGFWLTEITHLKLITTLTISMMSGGMIPLDYFPNWFQKLSRFLPFRYLVQFPVDVYLGRLSVSQVFGGLLVLVFWCFGLTLSAKMVIKKGLKIYESYN